MLARAGGSYEKYDRGVVAVSHIDGRKVNFRGKTSWVGMVIGDSSSPGHVRVLWESSRKQTGIHKASDLVVIDEPPTQEDLAAMFRG